MEDFIDNPPSDGSEEDYAPMPPRPPIESLIILSETRVIKTLRLHIAIYQADNFYNLREYYFALHIDKAYQRIRESLQFARENAHTYIANVEEPEYNYFNDFLICEIGEFIVTLRGRPYEEWIEVLEDKLHDFFINGMESLMLMAYQVNREGRYDLSTFLCPYMNTMDVDLWPEFKLRLVRKCKEKRLENAHIYFVDRWFFEEDDPEIISSYTFDYLVETFILMMNEPQWIPGRKRITIETLTKYSEIRILGMLRSHLLPYTAETIYNLRDYYIAFSAVPATLYRWTRFLEYATEYVDHYLNNEKDPERSYFLNFIIIAICKFYKTLGNKTFNEYKEDLEKQLQNSFIKALDDILPMSYHKQESTRYRLETLACPMMESMNPATIFTFKRKMLVNCHVKRLKRPKRRDNDFWVFEDDFDVINGYTFDFIFQTFVNSTLDYIVINPHTRAALDKMKQLRRHLQR